MIKKEEEEGIKVGLKDKIVQLYYYVSRKIVSKC